jgi:hypothetical protein
MTSSCSLIGFEPSVVSSWTIRGVGPLGYDPLESKIAGAFEYLVAGLNEVFAVGQQRRRLRQNLPKERFAFGEGLFAKVYAIKVEEVESVVPQPVKLPGRESILQAMKREASIIFNVNNLAIDDGIGDLQFRKRCAKRFEAKAPIVGGAGKKFHVAAIDDGQNAVAIKLDLVHPMVAPRRSRNQRGKLWSYEYRGFRAALEPRISRLRVDRPLRSFIKRL